MVSGIRIFLCFSTLCLLAEPAINEVDAQRSAIALVRASHELQANHFLRAVRREDFEDDVFSVQLKIAGQIQKAVMFFEITDTGYEVISPTETLFHSSVDGANVWIVGVETASGRTLGLLGFTEAADHFNLLAKSSRLRVDSLEAARNFGFFYVRTVIGASQGFAIGRTRDLQRSLEDMIDAGSGTKWRVRSIDEWLRRMKTVEVDPRVKETPEGYSVSLAFSAPTPDGPIVKRLTLQIRHDGLVVSSRFARLYPTSAARGTPKVATPEKP